MNIILVILLCCSSVISAQSSFIPAEQCTPSYEKPLVFSRQQMVVANNKWAAAAARQMLARGGNAVDAAIAASFVLGLTEPQSSGIGGGGFALSYQQAKQQLHAYDGREMAPASASPTMFLTQSGQAMAFDDARFSVKSVGVPGEVALLMGMHQREGQLPWSLLLQPAIRLANTGFPMSPRLHHLLVKNQTTLLQRNSQIKNIYFDHLGQVKSCNSLIKNPAYARVLSQLVVHPESFYSGSIARDIIKFLNKKAGFAVYKPSDLADYRIKEAAPLCANYRTWHVCSTPFESGGVTTLQLLTLYANAVSAGQPGGEHPFLQASKLAYADRNQYIADPSLMQVPLESLIDPNYLRLRSQLIGKTALKTPLAAGDPLTIQRKNSPDRSARRHGTTSIAIVDKMGNAISMTLSIEHEFGSQLFVDGFFLNNQLTDFSLTPLDQFGRRIANQVTPLKRPRSAISPVMVFDQKHKLAIITGSPGGAPICCYVAKNIIQLIDFKKNPKQSAAAANLCAMNDSAIIESDSELISQIPTLQQQGEDPQVADLVSGIVTIQRTANGSGWCGAADPRREGVALE